MDYLTPNPDFYDIPFTTDTFNGMPYRPLGRSGLRVPVVGLGTWKFGYPETGDGARTDEATAFKILDRSIELGVTLWDTANRYNASSGNSERIIGNWLQANPDQRRNVIVATKIFGGMDGITPNHSRLGRQNILDATYACMERLQIDHIDLLYFHRFEGDVPVDESLSAIEDLVQGDMVRYFAVSNFSEDQLAIYQSAEKSHSIRSRVVAVQNRFDPLHGEHPDYPGVLNYCAHNGISYVSYSPLAKGLLTDRYLQPAKAGKGDRLYDEGTLGTDANPETMTKVNQLHALAKEWGIKLNELTLAYILTLPGMGPPIPSASSVAQLESNAKAGSIILSAVQQEQIKSILG